MNILLVGGRFDDDGGRPSGYITKLAEALRALGVKVDDFNGGPYDRLPLLVNAVAGQGDVVLWFADVPNDKEKVVGNIKRKYPRTLLVTSKRNEPKGTWEYSFQEVVAHALRLKSNLVVQFRHDITDRRRVLADIFDPLGNHYPFGDPIDIQQLARCLLMRLRQLRTYTRMGSHQAGDYIDVPDDATFFQVIKLHAETFHELLNPQQTDRFLGNASFRCARGFPSFRGPDEKIFVSRRNVDKRYIGQDAFVAVEPNPQDRVQYYGEHKPSVDTPIQLRLYHYYRKINYMVHGHVYVQGGYDIDPWNNPIPCGAMEEVEHLCRFDRDTELLALNIKHHGCIIMGATAVNLGAAKFSARPAPEDVREFLQGRGWHG